MHFLGFYCFIVIAVFFPESIYSQDIQDVAKQSQEESHSEAMDVKNIDQNLLQQLSEDEQHWYAKFQNGLMFFDGWKQISEDILLSLPVDERPEAKALLGTLGIRIGTEWSKDNSIRKIDTDQLHEWGKRLRHAKENGAEILQNELNVISTEVESILAENQQSTALEK